MTQEAPKFLDFETPEHSVDPVASVILDLDERYLMTGLLDDDGNVLIPSAAEDAARATAQRDEADIAAEWGFHGSGEPAQSTPAEEAIELFSQAATKGSLNFGGILAEN